MKRVALFLFLLAQIVVATADSVKGRVVDAETGEPLGGMWVKVSKKVPEGGYYVSEHLADSLGVFHVDALKQRANYTIEVNYFGYEPFKETYEVKGGLKDTLDLGELKMKISASLLKELMVEAKARRFVMRGDTVVFNPEAFNMEDGERVSALLRKLPGVTIDKGRLLFMGKQVKLKMNGNFVPDEFFLAELPVEAVQDIKAYEQKSETEELTGMNDGARQQVLDITIKKGFMDKWYGQLTGTAYASKNYFAKANTHYLSDSHPFHLYVRASDNGTENLAIFGEQEFDDGKSPLRQQMGKASYSHSWKKKGVTTSYKDNWAWSITPKHTDRYQYSWSTVQTFIAPPSPEGEKDGEGTTGNSSYSPTGDGGAVSHFENYQAYTNAHTLLLPLNVSTSLHLTPKTTLKVEANASFQKNRDERGSESQLYRSNAYSEEMEDMITSSKNQSISNGQGGNSELNYTLTHVWKRHEFTLSGNTKYQKQESEGGTTYDIEYFDLGTQETIRQTHTANSENLNTTVNARLALQLIPQRLALRLDYSNTYDYGTSDQQHYRNGIHDQTNSYHSQERLLHNKGGVTLRSQLGKFYVAASMSMTNTEQSLDYQRGTFGDGHKGVDTLARRNYWMPQPSLDFSWKPQQGRELSGRLGYNQSMPGLLNSLDYTDDTNPMAITKGNPNLRRSGYLQGNLSYRHSLTRASQMLRFSLSYMRQINPMRNALCRDPHTGISTFIMANVDRAESLSGSISYDRSLGDYFRLQTSADVSYGTDRSIQTRTSLSQPMVQVAHYNLGTGLHPTLSYTNDAWEAEWSHSLNYNKVEYETPGMYDLHLWRYNTTLTGRYRARHWTYVLEGRLLSNRGYLSPHMNRERINLSASITWRCLQNRGQLRLSAQDLLNQMKDYTASVSPTQISEEYSETFHRYLALTFTYNFDARAKGKAK